MGKDVAFENMLNTQVSDVEDLQKVLYFYIRKKRSCTTRVRKLPFTNWQMAAVGCMDLILEILMVKLGFKKLRQLCYVHETIQITSLSQKLLKYATVAIRHFDLECR